MKLQEKRNMMLNLVDQWQQSGMTQKEFAGQNNMSVVKLRYWVSKFRQGDQDTSFIQLSGICHDNVHIRYPNGVELSLPNQTSTLVIKSLVNI